MFASEPLPGCDKATAYGALLSQLRAMLTGERDWLANCANTAALLFQALPDLNWAGYYLVRPGTGEELVLGPFQGNPACVRIAMGRGVCGTAGQARESVIVADVREFPDHIACDSASRSELVVPLLAPGGQLLGVLDLDSPRTGRFDEEDRRGCEALVAALVEATDFPSRTSAAN
jgi:L-methionine (R)-S-oxide reductase